MIIEEVGIREFREIIKRYGNSAWYRLNKEMLTIDDISNQQPFSTIRRCLEEFKPLKLIYFQKNENSNSSSCFNYKTGKERTRTYNLAVAEP